MPGTQLGTTGVQGRRFLCFVERGFPNLHVSHAPALDVRAPRIARVGLVGLDLAQLAPLPYEPVLAVELNLET